MVEVHNVFGFLVCAVIGLVEGSSSVGGLLEAVGNVVAGGHLVEARNVVDLRIMSLWLYGRLSLRSFIPDACGGALRKSVFLSQSQTKPEELTREILALVGSHYD